MVPVFCDKTLLLKDSTMNNLSAGNPRQLHYAWVVAFVGGIAVFCALGLGRFAFGMMLPSISTSLGLNYTQSGILGFGNLAGYLMSVPLVPSVLRRFGTRTTVTFGLLLMSLSMFAMSATHSFFWLTAFYFLTGLGSGAVVVSSMSVTAKWFAPSHRGLSSGMVMAGPGFGIILSGFAVPRLGPLYGISAWQVGWLIFGAITACVALFAILYIRNHPNDVGQAPYGRPATLAGSSAEPLVRRAKFRLLAHMGLVYGIYGAIYMLYMTFIVTSMVDSYGMSKAQAGSLWSWFGFLSIFSGLLFGALSDKIGRRAGMAIAFGILAVSFGLVGFGQSGIGLYISVILFGFAVWSIPVIMSASAGDYFGSNGAASALAALTLMFSAGQALGPVFAGILAEKRGDFSLSYTFSAIAALFAIGLVLALRPPKVID